MLLKRSIRLLCLVLCCLLTAACTERQAEDTPPSSPPPEPATISELQPDATEGFSVLTGVLGARTEEVDSFSYYDMAELIYGDGSMFPAAGAGAITFSCERGGAYEQEQNAFTMQLARGLAAYPVREEPGPVDEGRPLPTGRYFTVWLELASNWNPILTFFDSGEIYVDVNGGDGVSRFWQAEDPVRFDELQALLAEIHEGLDALPLDFHLSMWLRHDRFRPESTALRLAFTNDGKDVVTAESLTLERETPNGWEHFAIVPTPDLAIAPRREYTLYAVDLAAIPGAQEPGSYRVTGTLAAPGDTLPLQLSYTIDAQADDLSSPPPPEMAPENAVYCERYVSMWSLYTPFHTDFDEEHYLRVYHPFHLYRMLSYAEGKGDEYDDAYGLHVPGEILESIIVRHFLFTPEQLRAWMPTREQNPNEYYDPATGIYHFEGGYGGVGYTAVVSDSRRQGDRLTLTVDWYNYEDNYQLTEELTLRLGEGDHDFVYTAGRVLEDRR